MIKPFVFNQIQDSSLEKEMNSFNIQITDSIYEYNGVVVPRVTHILSEMLHEDYLMSWANFVGRIKHQDHTVISEEAAHVGTCVHAAIEAFLLCGHLSSFLDELNMTNKIKMQNAFQSFLNWWEIINKNNNITDIRTEEVLACPWFGGTVDCGIRINDKRYLIDFKTSNHFSFKYHLQLAAYRRLWYYNFGELVDGVLVLKLGKKSHMFQEQVIDLSTHEGLMYMNQCDQTFMSLVYAYYNRHTLEREFSRLY